jgi:hypothetical protein
MISTHHQVATSSEPWLLLPVFDLMTHSNHTFSTYGHAMATQAIKDFERYMGEGQLQDEMRKLVLRLYSHATTGEDYFLDKTPRYHFISSAVVEMFPEGKPIVLVRHPLAIVASILETWADKKWYLYGYQFDLYEGIEGLEQTCIKYADKVLKVRYEDLLTNPSATMQQVFQHIGIQEDTTAWQKFSQVEISGHMKDPTGIDRYKEISAEPLDKWKKVFYNRYRVAWAHRYLNWLGKERLAMFGYDIDEIRAELDALPKSYKGIIMDSLRSIYGWWRITFQRDVAEHFKKIDSHKRNILR